MGSTEVNRRKREGVKRRKVGRELKVKVIVAGDSKFRPFRVGAHLGMFNQRIKRASSSAEFVRFELVNPIQCYPGKSCRDPDVCSAIMNKVGEICCQEKNQLFLVLFSMGGNGVFTRTGLQSDASVTSELDAHRNLLSELLRRNPNLCALVFGVLPRPAISQHKDFLRRVNYVMRDNMVGVSEKSGGRVTFEEVGKTLRAHPELFSGDRVHLTVEGTRIMLTEMTQYFSTTAPLKFASGIA